MFFVYKDSFSCRISEDKKFREVKTESRSMQLTDYAKDVRICQSPIHVRYDACVIPFILHIHSYEVNNVVVLPCRYNLASSVSSSKFLAILVPRDYRSWYTFSLAGQCKLVALLISRFYRLHSRWIKELRLFCKVEEIVPTLNSNILKLTG